MSHLSQQVIVTGLAASVSPIAIVACIDMLSLKNPVKSSLAYLSGFTLTLLGLGFAGVYIFQIGQSSILPKSVGAYLDIALGVICFGLLLHVLRKQPSQKQANAGKADRAMNPGKAFIIGTLIMTSNLSTLVIFVSGLRIIMAAELGITQDILYLAALTLITLTTVIAPLLIYLLSPQTAGKLLASIGTWLNEHSKIISVIILAVFGFYLIMRGLGGL